MRPLRVLLTALAVLALAGCTAIPTSGPVGVARARPSGDPGLVFLPSGPADGAAPVDIVQGFVQAASAGRDYAVAKRFLTREFAARWRPNARVLVHDRSTTVTGTGTDSVQLRVPVSGEVDAAGSYAPRVRAKNLQFRLQRVGGQWRIAQADDGIVLGRDYFLRLFQHETLQFFATASTRLVPDLRWFPPRRPRDEDDAVVRALIAGASAPVVDVVDQVFPPSTRLLNHVERSGSTISIDLAAAGAEPDRRATDRMQQQLGRSLAPAAPRPVVRLSVNGRVAPPAPVLRGTALDPRPVALANGRFGPLTDRGVTDDPVLGRRIVQARPSAVTVSAAQRVAVLLTGAGVAVVDGTSPARLVDGRAGLIPPTLDQRGWAYSVPRDEPGGLVANAARRAQVHLDVGLAIDGVDAVEVSPDGTRMLVLGRSDSVPTAYVAGIERAPDGTPTALSTVHQPVAIDAESALDATWVDDGSVAVLTSSTDQQDVVVLQLGGLETDLGSLSRAGRIVGTTGQADLRVLTDVGDVYRRTSTVWQSVFATPVKVAVLAVQR